MILSISVLRVMISVIFIRILHDHHTRGTNIMKLQQLEYFVTVSKCGSLGKAAAQLYTSQPNVSKVIHSLESELGHPLFERTTRGLRLNGYGKSIYEYAVSIIKDAEMITQVCTENISGTFNVSTYQSTTLARLLVQLYKAHPELRIEHRQGNVEEVVGNVENSISELGIIYISRKYKQALLNILTQKKLEFFELGTARACITVGPKSPLYHRTRIPYSELAGLHFVRGIQDYFSENDFSRNNIGIAAADALQTDVFTNCNLMVSYLLEETDLADFGINLVYPDNSDSHRLHHYKTIEVAGTESAMVLGYITEKDRGLSDTAAEFIRLIRTLLDDRACGQSISETSSL